MEPTPPSNRRRPGRDPSTLPPGESVGSGASSAGVGPLSDLPPPPDQTPGGIARALAPGPRREGLLRRVGRKLGRVASATAVAALLAGSIAGGRAAHRWVTHTPRFGAREIDVSGLRRSTRVEVLAAGALGPGTNVLGLDTERAERAIERLPWIERAHVSRRLPGYVRVEVEERTAVALVSAGGLYLTAADGTLFKRLQPGDPSDLPVITGVTRQDFERDADLARENVRDAMALLVDLSSSSLAGRVRVDEVHRDPTGDLSMVLSESGIYVWLGRGPYRAKMARLSAILAELTQQHVRVAEIHLESDRHPERATVRLPVPEAPPEPVVVPVAGASTPPAAASRRRDEAGHGTHHRR